MKRTLNSLAYALRGMPRDAPILIQTPDGLRPVVLVSGTRRAETDTGLRDMAGGSGGRYAIVLHPDEG